MSYDLSPFKVRLTETKDHFKNELSGVRTGRATPLLLDNVSVESYGSRSAIKHVASITVEDARTLRIAPWDKGLIKPIETAIAAANLGISTAPDAASIRVTFPELSEERRKTLIKLVRDKMETSRISIRQEREKVWNDVQSKEKGGAISEDEKFKSKDEIQKLVDQANSDLEDIASKKEKEIQE
jgi:ribosome recycling factor